MTNYKAIHVLRVGEHEYFPGEVFTPIDDRDWNSLVRFGIASETNEEPTDKKITAKQVKIPSEPLPESTEDLTSAEKSVINTRKAIVKEEAKGWLKVYDENGLQLGKATRDQEEAELIKMEYETAPE